MKKLIRLFIGMLIFLLVGVLSFTQNYRNDNFIVKKTKIVKLKKKRKGYILYSLRKGRYRITVDNGITSAIDQYIYGEAEEFNPLFENEKLIYEIDTDKAVEVFKQEYKTDKTSKVKIKIEKLE